MAKTKDVRTVVVELFTKMLNQSGSLSNLLPVAEKEVAAADRSLLKALSFGLARHGFELQALVDPLLQKPMKKKDLDVYLLLQLGVLQIEHMNVPSHAAVDATVSATKALRKPWAKGLVNAVLRNFIRRRDELVADLSSAQRVAFPPWMYEEIKKDWNDHADQVFIQSNLQAPMVLRVNTLQTSVAEYKQLLGELDMPCSEHPLARDAIVLGSPMPVDRLPGFDTGAVSVQDAAAQLAIQLIVDAVAGTNAGANNETPLRILDACAAPGGKTAHLLESFPRSTVTAMDISESRLQRVSQNLDRLSLRERVQVVINDAARVEQWWDGEEFDVVMLDAPCSGTGVIRRHPDIKQLRRDTDTVELVATQTQLLKKLWETVKPGGFLMYATCSIFNKENVLVVQAFFENRSDCVNVPLDIPGSIAQSIGNQLLPGIAGTDGFYYSLLQRSR